MEMVGRKRMVLAFVLGSLLIWGIVASPLRAAEADVVELIKVLRSKNIVTQQEADSLLKEIKTNNEKEKTEIKKEIVESAKKGDFLPSALKGFKVGTTVFAEWSAKDIDNGASSNSFAVNRAYLTLTKEVNDWLGLNVTTDIFTSKDSDDKANGWEIRLKNAYANLNLIGTQTRIGLIPTFSDSYDSAIWPYRVQGKNLLDETEIQSSADFGISNQGTFGGVLEDEEFLAYAGKAFAGKWGGYMAGVYNGSGYSNSEANGNKVISGLVYVRPFPTVEILKGLQLAYTGTYGKSNEKIAAGNTDDFPDLSVNVVQTSLQHKMFAVMGQYYWGKGAYKSTEENDRKGYLIEGFVRIPYLEKLRLFGKYYRFDPNTDINDDEYQTYVGGLSYDFSKEFMPFISYEHRKYEVQTAKLADYDKYQIGFQLKF
jgi:hypothetical protein